MNWTLLKGAAVLLLLTGCTGQSTHEKAIADFVQTDKRGTWTDLQFKVIEMSAPAEITVMDSITILTDAFETEKAESLARLNETIARHKVSIEKENFKVMKAIYQKWIDRDQAKVDSLAKTAVVLPEAYQNAPETTLLAKEITCKFSIVPPTFNSRQEITETFLLNPAGDRCYRRIAKKRN